MLKVARVHSGSQVRNKRAWGKGEVENKLQQILQVVHPGDKLPTVENKCLCRKKTETGIETSTIMAFLEKGLRVPGWSEMKS